MQCLHHSSKAVHMFYQQCICFIKHCIVLSFFLITQNYVLLWCLLCWYLVLALSMLCLLYQCCACFINVVLALSMLCCCICFLSSSSVLFLIFQAECIVLFYQAEVYCFCFIVFLLYHAVVYCFCLIKQ